MSQGNKLLCPFCGEYLEPVEDVANVYAACNPCGIVLSHDDKAQSKFGIKIRPNAKKFVKDTYQFLSNVCEGQYTYWFSKELPFTPKFDINKVVHCDDTDLSKNNCAINARLRRGKYDLIAFHDIPSHNMNKAFTYASMNKCGLKLALSEFSSLENYVFVMACLDTYISPMMQKAFESSSILAKRLAFPEAMLATVGLFDIDNLPPLSDSAMLYSAMVSGSAALELKLSDFDVTSIRKYLIALTSEVTLSDDYTLDDFEELRNMPEQWRDQFLLEYCKAIPDMALNVHGKDSYSTFSILRCTSKLSYKPEDLVKDKVIHEIGRLRLLSYLNNKYYASYEKLFGYEAKLEFLKQHGYTLIDDVSSNIRLFWIAVYLNLKKEEEKEL